MKKFSPKVMLSLSWLLFPALLTAPKANADSARHPAALKDAVYQQDKPSATASDIHVGVATIRESSPDETGVHIGWNGRRFQASDATLDDLIRYIYKLNAKQIDSSEKWISSTNYDIVVTADSETMPTEAQWLAIVKELLADRFGLKYHYEDRVSSVYILGVARDGPKLTNTKGQAPLPDLRLRGLGSLTATNASMKDLVQLFQGLILNRPVVDHTNLTGKYDFQLNWTVDASQYDGRFANWIHNQPADPNRPGLTTALTEQLGLTLTAGRDKVPIFVIDQVNHPSPN